MEPKDFFKKPILGQLVTRKIDNLYIDKVPTKIESIKVYDVIDVVIRGDDKLFVVNQWENESLSVVLAIHNNFVRETIPHELRFKC